MTDRLVGLAYGAAAILLALLGWEFLHHYSDGWVPGVAQVGASFVEMAIGLEWLDPLAATSRRLLIAFVVVLALGVLIGTAMGVNGWVDAYGRPLLVIGLAIPDPVYFMLGLLLLGTTEFAAMTALVLCVLPLVTNVVVSGVQNRDRNFDEMSFVYGFPLRLHVSEVLLRQITPMLATATRTAFAFSWKLVVLMEVLTQPDGIGAVIYTSFRLLRADRMIVFALLFIIVMNLVERLVFAKIEERSMRWSA